MTSFAAVADLQGFLGKTFAVGTETTQAQAALDIATAEIKAWTGQAIAEAAETVVLDPNDASVLFLPQLPVSAVSAVSVDNTAQVVATDVDWYSHGAIRRASGASWGTKRQSISVTYTHGFATIPDDLKRVCVKRAARLLGIPGVGAATLTADTEGNATGRRWSMEGPEPPFDSADEAVMERYRILVVA